MRVLLLAVAIGLIAAAVYVSRDLTAPHNVYGAPLAQVHEKLAAMAIPTDADGPLGAHPVTKTDDAPTAISWAGGPRGAISCTARLEAVTADTTRVAVNCTADASDNHAALALARIAMTEQVDSTLRGRPYNKQAVVIGASAVAALDSVPAPGRGGLPTAPTTPGGSAPDAAPSADGQPGPPPPATPPPAVNDPVIPTTPVG